MLDNIAKLVRVSEVFNIPVVVTEQYPKGLGRTVRELESILKVKPIEKTSFSCFGAPEFEKELEKLGAQSLILTGIETHICVVQTALDALKRGYEVIVPADATGSRKELDWRIALDRMLAKGVDVVTTEMLLFDLIGDAARPEFKEILKLVKGR